MDICAEEGMPVVIRLSLPGTRWRQKNNNKNDVRLWNDPIFQQQAAKFWKDLVLKIKDHPAIIGYNIINEPHLKIGHSENNMQIPEQKTLFEFYNLIIENIRSVDKDTPIILDGLNRADPKLFETMLPHDDPYVLHSFHMYEPFAYTNFKENQGRFIYPGIIDEKYWDKNKLEEHMSAVLHFQKKHNIPSFRIFVGEFGGDRRSKGLALYFQDLITIFNKNQWHFAFYAFRDDNWNGMNYELGSDDISCAVDIKSFA